MGFSSRLRRLALQGAFSLSEDLENDFDVRQAWTTTAFRMSSSSVGFAILQEPFPSQNACKLVFQNSCRLLGALLARLHSITQVVFEQLHAE